jgi:hypothetical protein
MGYRTEKPSVVKQHRSLQLSVASRAILALVYPLFGTFQRVFGRRSQSEMEKTSHFLRTNFKSSKEF